MKRRPLLFVSAIALGAGIVTSAGIMNAQNACAAGEAVSFKEDILPLLKWRCASCHEPGGAGYEKSGLDLTSYAGVMKGTKFGPMIIRARAGKQQFDVAAGLARLAGLAYAARPKAIIDLRPQQHPYLDPAGRQGQLRSGIGRLERGSKKVWGSRARPLVDML